MKSNLRIEIQLDRSSARNEGTVIQNRGGRKECIPRFSLAD